jgi:fibronectin type III domain protein
VTATAGNASATVSFTAPASNGGSPITSYTVTASPGGATATGSASPITVTGLTNGTSYTFTVTATNAIGTGPPSAASNAVTPAAVGPITVDKTVFTDGSGTMTSPSLTTTTPNDLIVAFVSSDGPASIAGQSFTVTGAGLSWTLAKRSNAQLGDSEIWWARASGTLSSQTVTATPSAGGLHGSLVVVAFAKAAGIGVTAASSAASGAPDLPLANTGAGSWVYAVGNDWDQAIARTPVSGQVIVHQRVDTSTGDTFWVQSTTAPNVSAGTVDIHDSAPTTDLWNYAGAEILPGS